MNKFFNSVSEAFIEGAGMLLGLATVLLVSSIFAVFLIGLLAKLG